MSREVKVGLLAIIAIFCAIWGYKFVKGQNMFKSTNSFYTTFNDVTALAASSPVLLNGFKIGQVTAIKLSPNDVNKMDVFFNIDGDIPLPKDAKIIMKSEGLVGGKLLTVEFKEICNGDNCAESGDFLQGQILGLLGSMVGADEVNNYVSEATLGMQEVLRTLGSEDSEGKVNDIIRNLDVVVARIAELSTATTELINSSQQSIKNSLANIDGISRNLAKSNEEVTSILDNINTVTTNFAAVDFKNTVGKTDAMIDQTSMTMKELNNTMASLDKSIQNLNSITNKMDDGTGTMGKLMNDRSLYDNLDRTSRNLSLLLQDLRLNPKRYVSVSVFGNKDRDYTLPSEDPALQKKK